MANPPLPKDPMRALSQLPGAPTSRRDSRGRKTAGTRLRKLVCSDGCGYIVRASRAAIDRGLPGCCCGGTLWPWDLDDVERAHAAGHLSDEQRASHPLVVEYERQCGSIAHGQAWADADNPNDPTAGAAWRVAVAVRDENRANQLAAARRLAAPDEMPF